MEIPTARVISDGHIRLGYSEADPYRWLLNGAFGVFPGLELSGRFTEIKGISSGLGSDYGDNKDKALDIKYQLLPETKHLPAVAIGLQDFHGTSLFPAEYVTISRQIFPFDFTMGIGSKRLKGDISTSRNLSFLQNIKSDQFIRDGIGTGGWGLFGGVEWAVTDRLHLMAEYNPIAYEKDKSSARGVPEGAASQFNFGLRIKAIPGVILGLSYQRGDTLGFMCHIQTKLGKPVQPKLPDPPLWAPVDRRPFNERDPHEMVKTIRKEIIAAGFKRATVYTDGKDLIAEIENNKYLSNVKAAGRVLRILTFYAPEDTNHVAVVLTQRGIRFLQVSVRPEHMEAYLADQIPENVFRSLVKVEYAHEKGDPNFILAKAASEDLFDYYLAVKPGFESYLNDPSGVFKARLGVQPYARTRIWKGSEFFARYNIPFYSNIDSNLNITESAVVADSYRYMGTDPRFDRLVFDQKFRLWDNVYAGFGSGYFNDMYAGIGGEVLAFLGDGNLAFGVEGEWVKKREPDAQFSLKQYDFYSLLANIYYFVDPIDVTLNAKYGRFLGGDVGWRFQVSREYDTGVVLGAWLSFTDTDGFSESYNRGYHDKGFFIQIPVQTFTNLETNRRWDYALSPWTRDVAQTVSYGESIWDMGSDLMKGRFKTELSDLKK